MEMDKLQRAINQLETERKINGALSGLSDAIISSVLTKSGIFQMVLDQARNLTDSEHGFVSSIDPQTGAHISHTLTKMKADGCSAPLTEGVLPEGPHNQYQRLWGYGLNRREAFYSNNPAGHEAYRGLPQGHVPLRNFLSVPVIFKGMLLGQIALANSLRDYTQDDIENVKKIAVFYAVVLQNHLWVKELQEATAMMEKHVEERTRELRDANIRVTAQYEEILRINEQNARLNQTLAAMNEGLELAVAAKTADLVAANNKTTIQYAELALAEQKLRRNAEIQSVLLEISEAALLSSTMKELYSIVHKAVGRVLPAKLFHINLHEEATNEIVVPFQADDVNFIPERRPVDKGMTEYIMRLGKAVHVTPDEMDRLRANGEYTLGKVQNVQVRHYLGAPLINPSGKPFGVISIILMGSAQSFQPEDVEVFSIIAAQVSMAIERKRVQEEIRDAKEQFELIFNTSPDGALILRMRDGVIADINMGYTMLSGWSREESIGRRTTDFNLWTNLDERETFWRLLKEKGSVSNFETTLRKKDGTVISGLLSANVTTIKEVPHMICVYRDISERKRMEKELHLHATIDGLSGIFNRRYFLSRANEELERMKRYNGKCSLLMLDIDHFKEVNDHFGHAVGDAAIQRIARICAESLRGSDILGRIGGEEFALLLLETKCVEAGQVAERLRRRIQDDTFGADQQVDCVLRVSIGVAELKTDDESVADLMSRADGALYRAKHEGRNKVVLA